MKVGNSPKHDNEKGLSVNFCNCSIKLRITLC